MDFFPPYSFFFFFLKAKMSFCNSAFLFFLSVSVSFLGDWCLESPPRENWEGLPSLLYPCELQRFSSVWTGPSEPALAP